MGGIGYLLTMDGLMELDDILRQKEIQTLKVYLIKSLIILLNIKILIQLKEDILQLKKQYVKFSILMGVQ